VEKSFGTTKETESGHYIVKFKCAVLLLGSGDELSGDIIRAWGNRTPDS